MEPERYITPKIFSKYKIIKRTNAARLNRPFATVGKIRPKISTILVAFTVDKTTGL